MSISPPVIKTPVLKTETFAEPIVSGTGEPGATLTLYQSNVGNEWGTTTVDENGNWCLRLTAAKDLKEYGVTAKQLLEDGTESDWASNVFFTVKFPRPPTSELPKHNIMGIDPCDSMNHSIFNTALQKHTLVDPRTGLFEVYVPLPAVTGNTGNGPAVEMSLFYTPLVNNTAGLGDGWSFAFTTYNLNNQQLTLHSGEILNIEKNVNYKDNSTSVTWDADKLTVLRKGGRTEVLVNMGSHLYVPESLTTDGLNYVYLDWIAIPHIINSTTYYQIKLTQIRDRDRELLKVDYFPAIEGSAPELASATLTFWPNTSETQCHTLQLEDNSLRSVSLAEHIKSTFEYQDHAICGWLLTTVTTVDGLKEHVTYKDNGLIFPNDLKLSELPCVETHTLTPNSGRKPVVTEYSYMHRLGEQNYLTYTTTGVEPRRQRVIYSYDKNHELIHTSSSQVEYRTDLGIIHTSYKTQAVENKAKRTKTIQHAAQNTSGKMVHSEERTTSNTFNQDWSIAEHEEHGMVTRWTYQNPAIDWRYMRETYAILEEFFWSYANDTVKAKGLSEAFFTRVTEEFPASYISHEVISSKLDGAISALKLYQFERLTGLSEAKVTNTFQFVNASKFPERSACDSQSFDYFGLNDLCDDFRKGRPKKIIQQALNSSGIADVVQHFDYTLAGTENTELTTTVITAVNTKGEEDDYELEDEYDKRTRSETHSILSGRLIRQTDEEGNRTEYVYNEFGQLTSHTVCAQSETYQQTTTYEYPAPGQLIVTEPNGSKRRSEFDGQENLIKEYLWDNEWRLVKQVRYDEQGRESRTTTYDYLADGTQISEWYNLKYDNWNEVCGRIYSDGGEDFNHYDPIACTRTEWTGRATDKHGKVTHYNSDETIKKIEWKKADGMPYETQNFTYTHAKQVASQVTKNEFGSTTLSYAYDVRGRLSREQHIETKDTETVTYTYHYSHSEVPAVTEAMKIEIEVNGVLRTLGERTFDRWGRVTSLTRGSSTETYTYEGASKVPTSKENPLGSTLNYEYIPELGNRVSKISTPGNEKTFTYAHGKQNVSTASEGDSFLEYQHGLNALVELQKAQVGQAQAKESHSRYSLGERLLSDIDAHGVTTDFSYNDLAQRDKSSHGDLTTTHAYDSLGRLSEECLALPDAVDVKVSYEYDSQQREIKRHFTGPGAMQWTLSNTYFANGYLKSCELREGAQVLGSRSLAYTAGGRLRSCITTGVWRPQTPAGKDIDSQVFIHDEQGNVISCTSTFGGERCVSTYTYDSATHCRLEKVAHDHADYPAVATLTYDAAGQVIQDQTGRKYEYDWLGRLAQAGSTRYSYDASDRLMTRTQDDVQHQIIYNGLKVRGEYQLDNQDGQDLRPGSEACTVQRVKRSGVERTLLQLRDTNGTVLITYDIQAETQTHHAYTAYGERASNEPDSLLGLNGEYRDASTGQYPLGQGYRWYDPSSLQFHAPDTLSPFDQGGPHAYGYCTQGDPINYQDPSGHLLDVFITSFLPRIFAGSKGVEIAVAAVIGAIGVVSAILTGGTSLVILAAAISLAVASMAASVISVVVAESNRKLSKILGWVSLATALIVPGASLLKATFQLAKFLGRSGMAVARTFVQNAAARMTPQLRRLGLFKNYGRVYGKFAPQPTARMYEPFPYTGAITPAKGATSLLGAGGLNTLVCATSGVLGNAGVFESESENLMNTSVNQGTNLPWGHFGRLLSKKH